MCSQAWYQHLNLLLLVYSPKLQTRSPFNHNIARVPRTHQLLNLPPPKLWQLHKVFDKAHAKRPGQLPILIAPSSKYRDDTVLGVLGHDENVTTTD